MPTRDAQDNIDPPCIVGMACRLPGGIHSPSELWDFLMRKGCAQGPVPMQRFRKDGFYLRGSSGSARGGSMDVAGGYFLEEDVRNFDNAFFGIHNLEAASICRITGHDRALNPKTDFGGGVDPQQRKLLEIVFECLEHAGTTMEKISGSNTGVFVGNFTLDHQTMQSRDIDAIHRFSATGCGTTILANRISHVFNLQGPSFTLDTACSSSLYALHSAVSALLDSDCDAAIVAAVNLIMSPEQCLAAAKSGVLSPTSTCHTFDIAADGYGRAEAMDAIYIKRLSSALRDGDKIWAVIRSTAVNANGKTPGITQPSADLQEAVIRKAYSKAGLRFHDSDYIECHGTGTPVGDPIEVDALGRCFNSPERTDPLLIGSRPTKSKPGLGHSEAASGLTALIKVALALEHGLIPPTYGVKTLNPNLHLDKGNMEVATEVASWPRELRRASINAFGYGGANAHCILESKNSYLGPKNPNSPKPKLKNIDDDIILLPISAASPTSLKQRVAQVMKLVEASDTPMLENIAYTLAERTSHFPTRHVFLAGYEGPNGNPRLLDVEIISDITEAAGGVLPIGLVFTGQGAQYTNMAKDLVLRNRSFHATIKELDTILQELPPEYGPTWSLEDTILNPIESKHIHDPSRSQPVCTAVQIALVNLLCSWGINYTAVVGHSSGEIAAAYAAGSLNARQAILVAYFRGYAVSRLERTGSMMAVGTDADTATKMIHEANLEKEVSVSCINSPESVTLSGSESGIDHLMREVQRRGQLARKLRTGNKAYHSNMMGEIGDSYEMLLAPHLKYADRNGGDVNKISPAKMYSSAMVDSDDKALILSNSISVSARYWRSNLEKPVQFLSALNTLLKDHKKIHLIEIGPHTALKGPVKKICTHLNRDQTSTPYSPTLIRGKDSDLCMKQLASVLFMRRHNLLWQNVNDLTNPARVNHFPPYPWDYSSGLKWQEPRASVDLKNRKALRHELLGSQQVAGNEISWAWRNVVNLSEIPWVCDHKLESQVVFPAAGYIAMAIEALSQARTSTDEPPMFELRHVDISTALVVPEGDTEDRVEMHTTLAPQVLSKSSISQYWYDFSISSVTLGRATLHCSGTIRKIHISESTGIADTDRESQINLEEWPHMSIWYDRFSHGGLKFGSSFKSVTNLRTDSVRSCYEAEGKTQIVPNVAQNPNGMKYPIHPITIDACIQVGIMGSAAGYVAETGVYLPVFVDICRIRSPSLHDMHAKGLIKATSTKSSPLTRRVTSTLWSPPQIQAPLVELHGVRMIQYKTTINTQQLPVQRQPCLRVCWKPDIGKIHIDLELAHNEPLAAIGALVDLLGHKNPLMRVLEVVNDDMWKGKKFLGILDEATGFRRCKSWQSGRLEKCGIIQQQDKVGESKGVINGPFDLLYVNGTPEIWDDVDRLHSLVAAQGTILTPSTSAAWSGLRKGHFTVTELPGHKLFVASRLMVEKNGADEGRNVFLVVHNPSSAVQRLAETLAARLQSEARFASVNIASLSEVGNMVLYQETICISLLEVENEFLASMDHWEMDHLRIITNTVTTILWLSGSALLSDTTNPDLSLSSGLSRALMLEHPALKFVLMDIGQIANEGAIDRTWANVSRVLQSYDHDSEREFVQKDGLLYISRISPSFDMNLLFRRRFERQEALVKTKLAAAGPIKVTIDALGGNDTLHFEQLREPICSSAIPKGFIDVSVKAVSLNAKDVYTLKGRVETRDATTALEFSGVVTAVGPDIAHLRPGDDVVVGMPCHFATSQRVPVWAAFKMRPGEQYATMATFPTIYGTALYGLCRRARISAGESILIHGGAGAFGFAAITVAKNVLGTTSNIYTTAGSDAKRKFIAAELGIPQAHIFHSRDATFAANIRSATKGRGVDVVVNFLTGDLLQASWECIAPFGRFVEIGKRDLLDAGRLDMQVFLRNTTFTAFDFSDLYYQQLQYQDETFSSLLGEVFEQYRSGHIKPPPITTFAAADVATAYRFFHSENRLGKVVISFEDENSTIPLAPSLYMTLLDPRKVYLLVGCLGGLGRSLTRWMVARGARNFVFLGRSGCDKQSALELVSRLREICSTVQVIRGDVVNRADVDAAVTACVSGGRVLGGVVQAAMGLHEALFSQMSAEGWQTGIQPKWKGTWNLHHAIEGYDRDLDFFLLTSSLSGSVGTATESNYCAANGFLDVFAHWRRCQNKPAVSVGLGMISEVGYLHENPEIEALLLRKGIQPLSEAEFLQVIDLALARYGEPPRVVNGSTNPAASHILTGLEPLGFHQLLNQGFDVDFSSAHDPRMAILAAALEAQREAKTDSSASVNDNQASIVAAAEWFRAVPAHAAVHLASEARPSPYKLRCWSSFGDDFQA
ncbi:hypothetical protein NUW58_g3615 [Xylaria curta]|uniref:Uncharacterized protein n=1 Tax=Xylaria curta TaxID=42375 RepID=A0ACC1PBN9_9PEZI|nr:hypothetical protein NUW58_g3615 [Xylaria curta]